MNEAEMIEGCKRGDRVAQHKLYKLYAGKMFAVCFRYASDRMDAEDILQEGFVKIFNGVAKYLPIGPFGAWVKTIMINTAIQHYRRNKRSIIDSVEYVPDNSPAEPGIIDSMSVAEVMDLVKKLPDGYKQIFNLYAIEGYKHYEIGEMLGISEGTSKSQYARAKKSLQEMIEPKQRMIEQKQSNG
ncbi:MAG: RNA polymerase sigma factor [Bacteroidota bacterium]|nr:RNA polymerase sigma factor [Bacteroidota bacterium]